MTVDFGGTAPLVQTFQAITNLGTSLPYGNGDRIPFTFSSRLRELAARLQAREQRTGRGLLEADVRDLGLNLTINEARDLVAQFSPSNAFTEINTLINPLSIQWDQGKRISRRDVRNGSVFFHFTDDRGQDNDILKLKIRGHTGNVDLRGDAFPLPATQDTASLRKLAIFQNLYTLTREPRLIPPRTVNTMTIRYTTKMFPAGITLFGFYESVISFEESADMPNAVEWSMEFTVQSTEPRLDEIVQVTQRLGDDSVDPSANTESRLFSGDVGG